MEHPLFPYAKGGERILTDRTRIGVFCQMMQDKGCSINRSTIKTENLYRKLLEVKNMQELIDIPKMPESDSPSNRLSIGTILPENEQRHHLTKSEAAFWDQFAN